MAHDIDADEQLAFNHQIIDHRRLLEPAIKGAFTAVAKIVVRYGAYGKSLSASAASPAARAAVEAKDAKIAGFGLGLAIVGL